MRNKLVIALVLLGSPHVFACDIPSGQKLVVGCTYKCDLTYKFRLKMAALGLGLPLKIVDLTKKGNPAAALAEVDAVLIPGGADIDPHYYLQSISPELRAYTQNNLNLVKYSQEGQLRDPYEYSLVKLYSTDEDYRNLPMLGICRGMQMMSVAQGIPLYLDIKTELGIPNRIRKFDRVDVSDANSLMKRIYKNKKIKGLKLHHQGIRVDYYQSHQNDYPQARVTAYSNNAKIAEAIEYTHRPALGVQYHPEKSFSSTAYPVFNWFLNKACEYKKSRKSSL